MATHRNRHQHRIALIAAMAVAALSVSASAAPARAKAAKPRPKPVAIKRAKEARLASYSSCDALLGRIRARALPLVRPYGLEGYWGGLQALRGGPEGVSSAPLAAAPAADAGSGGVQGVDYSGTNVQEVGVDEPDVVKTDGRVMYTVTSGKLVAVLLNGGAPKVLDSVRIEQGSSAELLISGSRILVIGPEFSGYVGVRGVAIDGPIGGTSRVMLTEIDASDPAALKTVQTLRVDGRYVSARLTGTTARVVVASQPSGLDLTYPQADGPAAEAEALAKNRDAIGRSTLANWLPKLTLGGGTNTPTVDAFGCDDVNLPPQFAGLGTLSVLTIDLAKGLSPVDTDAVMTDGELVYASQGSLYVTTQRWSDPQKQAASGRPGVVTSLIHRFDIAKPDTTTYRASGSVRGWMLNQFSMSELGGVLRVATTDAPPWWGGNGRESESFVTTLVERDGAIARVGQVGGLGRGEQIRAVRFIGTQGYVVTFRQTDPLYVVDVANPAAPRVRGELKIPGYSGYLQPVRDGLLIGIGQDADASGRVKGTQVSLFDVSNPAAPRRADQLFFGQGWSEAEWDPHAVLYWAPTGLGVIPVGVNDARNGMWTTQALGFRVDGLTLRRSGSVVHPTRTEWDPIRRSLVARGLLYTVSAGGVMASTLDTLSERAWLQLPTDSPTP